MPVRRTVTVRAAVALACIAVLRLLSAMPVSAGASPVSPGPSGSAPTPIYSAESDDGILFLNGRYVPTPVLIEATSEQVIVNGFSLSVPDRSSRTDAQRNASDTDTESGDGISSDDPWEEDWAEFTEADEAELLNESSNELLLTGVSASELRIRSRMSSGGSIPTVSAARRLAAMMQEGRLVIAFDGEPIIGLDEGAGDYDFAVAALADPPTEEELIPVLGLAPTRAARGKWQSWLSGYTPEEPLAAILRTTIERSDAVEREGRRQILANNLLQLSAYPMTMVGMLLGVIGFGHVLSRRTQDFTEESESLPESGRYVTLALLLMAGMSVVDLIWTVLAGQAGVMREVNPLAAAMISSPLQLSVFKAVATGIGLGILYKWRFRRQIQQATWWMCMVCVLLMFRWVMFDSMNH